MRDWSLLILFLAVLAGCARPPQPILGLGGGDDVGNGADNLPADFHSAWFLGPRKIRYCYEVSSDFPLPPEGIESALANAFSTWRDYLELKRVNVSGTYLERRIWPNDPRLVFDTTAVGPCRGGEDLTFYLGVTPSIVRRYLPSVGEVSAFAQRLRYDDTAAWGNGFVWVSARGPGVPDWRKPHFFRDIITHELGHVLGCGHLAGTVMDETLPKILLRNLPRYAEQLTRIDGFRELLTCEHCGFSPRSNSGYFPPADLDFPLLVGRPSRGKVTSRLNFAGPGEMLITVKDSIGTTNISLDHVSNYFEERISDVPLFKVAYRVPEKNTPYVTRCYAHNSRYDIQVHSKTGTVYTGHVVRNGEAGAILINYERDQPLQAMLFESDGFQFPDDPDFYLLHE